MRIHKRWCCAVWAGLAVVSLLGVAHTEGAFGFKQFERQGKTFGVVTSFGAHLFVISRPSGGYSVVQRAQIVAGRLNALVKSRELSPSNIDSGVVNGQQAVYFKNRDGLKEPVVTADPFVAEDTKVESATLAAWWAALLKDHLSIVTGVRPRYTTGTETGRIFERIFEITKGQTGPAARKRLVAELSRQDRIKLLMTAWKVDPNFDPGAPGGGSAPQ